MEELKLKIEELTKMEESKKIEILKRAISELNSWNGCLDFLDYQENDEEFFEIYFGNNTLEAVRAVCYGEYNYCDDLVIINAYGNLESINEYEFNEMILENEQEIIENIENNFEDIDVEWIFSE